ncbi:hypothetical protein [Nocardia cyriacigeorgica]|uniref:hypothetical protein n=1 Tax=Nocardia cyriacigeorgica TaxID=135487 RepID=UPI001893DFA2|nr:hypothetical protein [Nocardia cyriacigeorgica]MBF6289864.1 hypothetical protein [Nocardia cyriacigeorgica]
MSAPSRRHPRGRARVSSRPAAKRPHVVIASLRRNVDDSGPEPGEPAEWVDWSCEYELRGDSVGVDDIGNPDLADVVTGVLDYARR